MAERTAPVVGTRLRSAREAKGVSLRDIEQTTKITTRALAAVERGELQKLPGGIYTRAVIRSYAAAVNLDPEEVLREFMAVCPGHIEPVPTLEVEAAARDEGAGAAWRGLSWKPPALRRAAVSLLLAGVTGYAALSWSLRPAALLPSSPVDALAAYGLSAAPVEPVVTHVVQLLSGDTTPAVVPALAAAPMTVELLPASPCWVSVEIDGGRRDSRLLGIGERVVIEAEREILLTIGDAGAVAVWINGRLASPIGADGRSATLRINAENLAQLLGS
jgi:cytoskeletal protein RodZ